MAPRRRTPVQRKARAIYRALTDGWRADRPGDPPLLSPHDPQTVLAYLENMLISMSLDPRGYKLTVRDERLVHECVDQILAGLMDGTIHGEDPEGFVTQIFMRFAWPLRVYELRGAVVRALVEELREELQHDPERKGHA